MNTISDISSGEFFIWLAVFIALFVAWNWPYKE
jgi:hypothetical protein